MALPVLDLVVATNVKTGITKATYKATYDFTQSGNNTTVTKGPLATITRSGVITGVSCGATLTASSDRTVTVTIYKRAKNALTSADITVTSTAAVLSSNNVVGTFARSISVGDAAPLATNVAPILSTTATDLAVANGDQLLYTITQAGSNGTVGTDASVIVEVTYNLGDDVGGF